MDAATTAAAVARRFPELTGLPVTPLGAGTDHAAFDLGGRVVLRAGGEVPATEAQLTAALAPCCPWPSRVPEYVAAAGVAVAHLTAG